VAFGIELRSCLTVEPDRTMVGCDASGLEARMMAHYVYPFPDGPELADVILNGDIHEHNAKLFETDRDGAKSPLYLLCYGGQPAKLADTLGCSLKNAERLFNNFWDGNPSLKAFRDWAEGFWMQHGYVIGLDGRKIYIRSKHSIVNALFQSAGSIVVKTAICLLLNKLLAREKLDSNLVLFQHDEIQMDTYPPHAQRVMELANESFKLAGEYYKMNVPLAGDSKEGNDWSQTH